MSETDIKRILSEWNQNHCVPPLDENDLARQWDCSSKYMAKQIDQPQTLDLPEVRRGLTKDDIDKNVIVEGTVHSFEDLKQAVTTEIYECGDCGVIYEERVDTCRIKTCRSKKILPILTADTLSDHRFIQITLFTKEHQQEGEGEIRVWVSLYSKLAQLNFSLGDALRIEGVVKVTKVSEKGIVKGMAETFIYIHGKNITPITDKKDISDLVSDEERKQFKEWAEKTDVVKELCTIFAPNIYGQDLVKESILYQIVGAGFAGNTNRDDIHICLIGDPSEGKTQLALAATNIAGGEYATGQSISAAGIGAGLVTDKATGRMIVEAGIAVKGNKRLKGFDEIDKVEKKQYLNQLLTIMENGFYKIDKVKHSLFETKGPWLCTGNPKDGRYNDNLSVLQNVDIPAPLLSRFDLVFILRKTYEEDTIKARLTKINESYQPVTAAELQKIEWIKKYLKVAREPRPIKIEPIVFDMLGDHYIKLNNASKEAGGLLITDRQHDGMIRLAIARARLHLRDIVTKEDAERSIAITNVMMRMSGVDPETGEVDANVFYGKSKSEVHRQDMAKAFFQELTGGNFDYKKASE